MPVMLVEGNAETEASRADIFLHGTDIPYGFPLLWKKKTLGSFRD